MVICLSLNYTKKRSSYNDLINCMRNYILFWLLLSFYSISFAQSRKTENLVIVTLDGIRWQEVFGGLDSSLLYNSKYTRDTAQLKEKYWAVDISERRRRLFPFLWGTIVQSGQIYGNRHHNNFMNVANPYQFSYPGYNEIFTGYPDTSVNGTHCNQYLSTKTKLH